MKKIEAQFPEKLNFLPIPQRYKVMRGGRGGGKSWGVARALLIQGAEKPLRILCAREVQLSIKQSVHQLLSDQIKALDLEAFYDIKEATITGKNGTQFSFSGLSTLTVGTIKSFEGYDICWIEEGQAISKRSWAILLPTIRKENSEIWVTYNPQLETDETHQRFTINQPDNCINVEINWRDNPWFPEVLDKERLYCKRNYPNDYDNIWEGKCRASVEGAIYRIQLDQAREAGRVTNVPVDKLPVYTAWDLGRQDATAIWFWQFVSQEIHIIDYYENSGEDLEHYAKVLQDKGYLYGEHYAPFDAQAKRLSAPSIEDRAWELGISFVVLPQENDIFAGIEAVRSIFHRFWFDKERTEDGLLVLKNYRHEWDERHQCFKTRPLHDWSSHGSDAMRYMARAIQQHHTGGRMSQSDIDNMYNSYAPPMAI